MQFDPPTAGMYVYCQTVQVAFLQQLDLQSSAEYEV
jgi:hypothetical protein